MKTSTNLVLIGAVTLFAACGGDDETCDPVAQTGCDEGVCAAVEGGEPICTDPVYIEGRVFKLEDNASVGGARVVALDVNRAPQSRVATSGDDGRYRLEVPAVRNADGVPLSLDVTLRADAAGYQSFPSGLRRALPVNLTDAVKGEGQWVLASALTDIGLVVMPAGSGTGTISGNVAIPFDRAGVMVVAETGGVGHDAIADRDGSYAIYNLPPGDYTVAGYARGSVYAPGSAALTAGASADVDLSLVDGGGGGITGMVSIVNGGGASQTSVVMFVESTFDEAFMRGAAPPGLRAPDPGILPDVSGPFTINGVPPGRYVVLAAFENDGLVRDPDTCISGTDIVHVAVDGSGTIVLDQSFKVTGALTGLSPTDDAIVDGGVPTITWEDDSSEDSYRVQVFDSFGNEVWTTTIPGVSGGTPTVTYAGPALDSGMYYQTRVTSIRSNAGGDCEISQSEDLAGVFYVP